MWPVTAPVPGPTSRIRRPDDPILGVSCGDCRAAAGNCWPDAAFLLKLEKSLIYWSEQLSSLAFSMRVPRRGLNLSLVVAAWLAAGTASAATLTIDYSLDTSHFFAAGSPARTTLEAAADFYSAILNDSLSPIQPPTFTGSAGTVQWHWLIGMNNPSASGQYSLQDQSLGADEYRIFASARTYTDNTLAVSSPGAIGNPAWTRSGPSPSSFTASEASQIYAMDQSFDSAVTRRGETSGFAAWGGSVSFDNDTNWHYDYTMPPAAGKIDLYSVAIHELAHTLGFGTSAEWTALVSGENSTAPRRKRPTAGRCRFRAAATGRTDWAARSMAAWPRKWPR